MSRFARPVEEVNPNLIPIMNLFTALIPFLLMSAAFFQLAIINITIPVAASGGESTDIAKDEDKITLNLRIKEDAFELSASSDTLAPDVLKKLKASVPRAKGGDEAAQAAIYKQLAEAAYQIKGSYAGSDTVIVVPDEDIPYEIVIGAADATRAVTLEREGERHRVVLFPKVVLSSMVK